MGLVIVASGTHPALAAPAKKTGPGFSLQRSASDALKASIKEQTILANIENQKMIIELEDASAPDFAEMLAALADFYWDLSEVFFRKAHADELEDQIFDAETKGDKPALASAQRRQQSMFATQRSYQTQAVDAYRDVIDRFPTAKKIDEMRYYLGYHLGAMGRRGEAIKAFTDLLLKHPSSTYVPDALVNIGDYHFDENNYDEARELYERIAQYGQTPVMAYALYKTAWCHYNLGSYDVAMDRLLSVIKLTQKQHSEGLRGAIDLMEEAQNELVYPYSKIGKPGQAIAFFRRFVPSRYLDISAKLAGMYTEQTEFVKSNKLLRTLMKEARKKRSGQASQVHRVLSFQRQIVGNAHRQIDKGATVSEIQYLITEYQKLAKTAPPEFMAKERVAVQRLILEIATGFHNEFKSTKATKTLEHTQVLYAEYLRVFRDDPNAYAISYNNALLLIMTGKYEQAASEFEKVILAKPGGKFADDAAERAVVAYLKSLQLQAQQVKSEAEDDLSRRELTEKEQRFVSAVDRWMAIVKRRGPSPETAENIPPARFAAAKILYSANHFDEAARRFTTFVDAHPDHPYWVDSARLVLSSYNLAHDVENLKAWAERFRTNTALMETDLREDVEQIRNEFNFLECFTWEKADDPLGAAECFLAYAEEFSGADKAPAAIYNAGLNFFKAKRVQKALETQKMLFEQYSDHELAAKALYSIGEIFRETTVYDQAADVYEAFVTTYGEHALAKKALQYASIFRKTLGQHDRAVANLRDYLVRFPNRETDARVHLDIVLIRDRQPQSAKCIKEVRRHLKRYPREKAEYRLQVLAADGRAWKRINKNKKARASFRKAVQFYDALTPEDREALPLAARSAVAESHFFLGEILLIKARWYVIKGSEKAMQRSIKAKLELMAETKKLYKSVISYGHPGWTIAAYSQLGRAYRDLADVVEDAEVPKRLKRIPGLADEYLQMMAERAEPIRAKAVVSYRTALSIARETRWFNEYAEAAEEAIAQLDFKDRSVKEFRVRPKQAAPNSAMLDFKTEVR
jgi:TolA-binding protein